MFRVPGGDIILSSSELKILIGRCALFSIQDGQDLIPKHGGAQFESDEWIFSLISSSSSTLSSASSSLTRGKTGGSSFDSVHCVESSDQKLLSRLCSSFLSSERQTTLTPVEECGQPKSADLLNLPSDQGRQVIFSIYMLTLSDCSKAVSWNYFRTLSSIFYLRL